MPFRSGAFVLEHIEQVRRALPFPLRGLDCDNDSAFMNETVFDFCKATGIELTRSRAYEKNDQAWVEQKNGAIVRRLVGYGRLRGLEATETLASLRQVSRLYINFFQPSFKLKSKTRRGTKVTKHYEAPVTPLERSCGPHLFRRRAKRNLRIRFRRLDPLNLLYRMREAQQRVAQSSASGGPPASTKTATEVHSPISCPVSGQRGRPARFDRRISAKRAPHMTGTLAKIRSNIPGRRYWSGSKPSPGLWQSKYTSASPRWLPRSNRARELVTRILIGADAEVLKADAATQRQPSTRNDSSVTTSRE